MGSTNGLTYLAFTADHPRADAVLRFLNRFGRAPQEVLVDPVETRGVRMLRVGPVETPPPAPPHPKPQGGESEQLILDFDEE